MPTFHRIYFFSCIFLSLVGSCWDCFVVVLRGEGAAITRMPARGIHQPVLGYIPPPLSAHALHPIGDDIEYVGSENEPYMSNSVYSARHHFMDPQYACVTQPDEAPHLPHIYSEENLRSLEYTGRYLAGRPVGYGLPATGLGVGYDVSTYYPRKPRAPSRVVMEDPQLEKPKATNPDFEPFKAPYVLPSTFTDVRTWQGDERWASSVCGSICEDPCFALWVCLFPWCCIVQQRKQLLHKDWGQYMCCAGVCGTCTCEGSDKRSSTCCCGWCRGGDRSCNGGFCVMSMEACLCCPCAIFANRFMLMKMGNLQRTPLEEFVFALGSICQPLERRCTCCFATTMCTCVYSCCYAAAITQQQLHLRRSHAPTDHRMM